MKIFEWFADLLRPGALDIAAGFHPDPSPDDVFEGPLSVIPSSREEVYRVFGNPGTSKPSRLWKRESMVVAKNLPGIWNKCRGKLYIHHLAEPYLREALRRAEVQGCLDEIHKIGCYTFRHQRHDPRRPLSYHSWGIAIDINPKDNRARKFQKGLAPEPFTPEWEKWWPDGLSKDLVWCFESVGWSWGGRWTRFCDPMHMEIVQ